WVLDRGRWLGDAGRQLIVGTLLDISSRKEMEQQLLRMAITGPLTGLSNRRAFNERLQLEWERLKRSPENKQHLCSATSITSSVSMTPMDTDAAMRCSSTLLHG
ncbi:GGDEF domain-containing protein, partial [Pseudomonas aeruginosa]|uniref:GGDEF domain-containing protein n=1 Tax=Pseudomonas aeruginosa TaxID=287 RepID=UPI00215D18FE